jgi:hypothetical protein
MVVELAISIREELMNADTVLLPMEMAVALTRPTLPDAVNETLNDGVYAYYGYFPVEVLILSLALPPGFIASDNGCRLFDHPPIRRNMLSD